MIIPNKIEIQIVDKLGNPNYLNNILLGLKIFDDDNGSWFNYSILITDNQGKVDITKEQILENTGLKWEEEPRILKPNRFEIYAWEGKQTTDFISSIKQLLPFLKDDNFLKQDLLNRGVSEENIQQAILNIKNKASENEELYFQIKDAKNDQVKFLQNSLEGIWTDTSIKKYSFIVEK